jgi:3-deoxy-7-phosphoheptulonate synthase
MIVVLETGTTEKQIEEIIRVLHDHGFDVHRSTGVQHTVLGAIGVHPEFDHRQIELLDGVAEVVRVTEPFKIASRAFKHEGSVFDIGGVKIGGPEVVVIAGPCSVETEEQIFKIAKYVKDSGVKILAAARLNRAHRLIPSRGLAKMD